MATTLFKVSSFFTTLAPYLMDVLILCGRPRAHHEEPIQALHSAMLQYGIVAISLSVPNLYIYKFCNKYFSYHAGNTKVTIHFSVLKKSML